MEQLTFELAAPEAPTFANFLPGRNAEAVRMLERSTAPDFRETSIVLWGAPGAGKSHLLRAAVAAAGAGMPAVYCASPSEVARAPTAGPALVAVDRIDTADGEAQGRLFTLYNALAGSGGRLLAAAAVPPARMPLRDDLRSRLGFGLVFEVLALTDAEKPAALTAYARSRGLPIAPDVVAYLLAHGRRDMPSLVTTVAALDRYSLSAKRPITVPLLKAWMQRDLPDMGPAGG
jgi:DnaA family protein